MDPKSIDNTAKKGQRDRFIIGYPEGSQHNLKNPGNVGEQGQSKNIYSLGYVSLQC